MVDAVPYYHGFDYGDGKRHVTLQTPDGAEDITLPPLPRDVDPEDAQCFEWGTRNNRAELLARAILSDFLSDPPWDLVDAFVEEHVSQWNREAFEITADDVREWIEQKTREAAGE